MKFISSNPPFISFPEKTRTLMGNVIISLLVLYGVGLFYYGPRALTLALTGFLSCFICEVICQLLLKGKFQIRDWSGAVTGLIIPLMMPASIPYHVVIVACVFAIVVVKYPFGGTGNNLFNPAAGGWCFAAVCFPQVIFSYTLPKIWLPLSGAIASSATSPALILQNGGIPDYDIIRILLGNVPGPMGASNILILLACLIFLWARQTVRWETPLAFLATSILLLFIFPRFSIFGRMETTTYELTTGLLLFGAVFLLSDPVTMPNRGVARIFYGVVAGVLAIAFRYYSHLEETLPFAVLLSNAMVPILNQIASSYSRKRRRRRFEASSHQEIS